MPRYTDIDKLIAEYDRVHIGPAGGARKLMVEAPIADVVPRAEVAREIFEEIEKTADACIESEWLRGSWFNMSKFKESLAELKNKYAEGEK
jgi:hypothetical protein